MSLVGTWRAVSQAPRFFERQSRALAGRALLLSLALAVPTAIARPRLLTSLLCVFTCHFSHFLWEKTPRNFSQGGPSEPATGVGSPARGRVCASEVKQDGAGRP